MCSVRLSKCMTEEANIKPVELVAEQCVLCVPTDLGYSRKDTTDMVGANIGKGLNESENIMLHISVYL